MESRLLDGQHVLACRQTEDVILAPVVGSGGAVWSFAHVDDVATATLAAIEAGQPGIYNIVDDEPAAVSEWLPELAKIVGAKPPLHIPAWIARLAIGDAGVIG